MTRTVVSLRPATDADAGFLAELWVDSLRRAGPEQLHADVEQVLAEVAGSSTDRIVVAEYDGQPAGAVYLRVGPLSPLNRDLAVQVFSPHVLARFRRRGVARHLIDAAVGLAEERGIGHVASAAASGSREGNRFLARLALGPQAVLRVAATHHVRAKLTAQTPVRDRSGARQLTQLLAARRSQRRPVPAISGEPVRWQQGTGDA